MADAPSSAGEGARTGRRPRAIVDSQVNVWIGGKPAEGRRQAPFLASDLLREMDTAGVARAIILPVSWNPDGIESPLAAATAHPDRFRVFGIYDLKAPPEQASIDAIWQREGVAGIRLFLRSERGKAWMTDGSADWFWPIAEREQIPLMIFPAILPELRQVIEKHPGLKLCIDSLGADPANPEAQKRFNAILGLGRYPNVAIKASRVPQQSGAAYPFRNMEPYLRMAHEAFGPRRMFWGSDITALEPIGVSYTQCVTSFAEMAWLSDDDLDLVMGKAISDWMGWPLGGVGV